MNPDQLERRGILAGGNWIVDRPKIIDVYPAQDSLANILHETSGNGGSPYRGDLPLFHLLTLPTTTFARSIGYQGKAL